MKRLFSIWLCILTAGMLAAQQRSASAAQQSRPSADTGEQKQEKQTADEPPYAPGQDHLTQYADSAVWQGMNIKVDIGNAVYTLLRSSMQTQQYEAAVNVNLLRRFYPTLEGGYGWSSDEAAGGKYKGHGGFFRVGIDINPLKKNRNSLYALLVGVRLGCGLQHYSLTDVTLNDDYWNPQGVTTVFPKQFRADCWGEIVAGLQITVAGPFTMGWYIRFHTLFTGSSGDHQPYYVPGYGCKDGDIFAFNYYLGFRL